MEDLIGLEKVNDQLIVRLMIYGIYPLYNRVLKEFRFLKNEKGFYFGTCKKDDFNKYWTRQLLYVPDGMLNDEQKTAVAMLDKFLAIELISKKI